MIKHPLFFVACVVCFGTLFGLEKSGAILMLGGIMLVFSIIPLLIHKKYKLLGSLLMGSFLVFANAFFMAVNANAKIMNLEECYSERDDYFVSGKISQIKQLEHGYELWIFSSNVIVYLSSEIDDPPCVGETVSIRGEVSYFPTARNDGNFDKKKYYRSLGIAFSVKDAVILKRDNRKNHFYQFAYDLKIRLQEVFHYYYEPEDYGLVNAMTLGDKGDMKKELKDLFQEISLSHIFVISGLHISLIAMGFYHLLRKLGRKFIASGAGGLFVALLFLHIAGDGLSAKRAVIMVVVGLAGAFFGRKVDLLNALGIAGIIILLQNPLLINNVSFQLSFLAVLGIGLLSETMKKRRTLISGVLLSLGISAFISPVILYYYFTLCPYSAFLNVFLLPLMGPIILLIMIGGIFAIMMGLQNPISFMCFLCSKGLLHFLKVTGTWIRRLPFSNVIVGKPTSEKLLMLYGILFLLLFVLPYIFQRRMRVGRAVKFGFFILYFAILMKPNASKDTAVVLDVGQGDAIFLQTLNGDNIMIDGGSSDVKGVGENRILPFLKSKGVRKIDYWFVSHLDEDHYSGLCEAFTSGYPIKRVVISHLDQENEKLEELSALAKANRSKVVFMKAGDSLFVERLRIDCIWPKKTADVCDENDKSLGLILHTPYITGLLCGDVTSAVEQELLPDLIPVDWYKCNHHGSKYSSSVAFLSVIKPKITTISCAKHNNYGHPSKEVIYRLKEENSRIKYTMYQGQINLY